MIKILMVEDTPTDAELALRELKRGGIQHQSRRVETEKELRYELIDFKPDVVLSDFSMPHFDGLSALKVVRQEMPDTPFIFVSGRIGEELAIESLKLGASDYVIKTNLSRLPSAVARAMEHVEQRDARRRIESELLESNLMFRTFMENLPGAAFIKDKDGRYLYGNHGLDKAFGVEKGFSIGKLDTELIPFQVAHKLREMETRVLDANTALQEIEVMSMPTGVTYWLSTKFPLLGENNNSRHIGGIAIEVTERMKVEQDLLLRTRAIEACVNPIVIVDTAAPGMPLIYVNGAFETITGYTSEEAIGRNCRFLQGTDTDQPELGKLRAAIREQRPASVLLRNYHKDGSMFLNELYIAPVSETVDGSGAGHFVGVLYDVTQIKRYQEDLEHQANYDTLTGLANRNLLNERTQQALIQARRHDQFLSLVFIDLDNFKLVNDSMGHGAGDELIANVGSRLQTCIRDGDTVARIGGDEFVLLLTNQNPGDSNLTVMQRIQRELVKPMLIRGQELVVTCSMGIARFPDDGEDSESLLANADAAMYRAKSNGRNNFQFYTKEMNATTGERLSLESDLWHAMANEELFLVYQPQIDFRDGSVIGMEALIRWQHPKRGLISPMEFIPMAECNGLIIPIGIWVLETACKHNLQLQKEGLPPIRVAVNLSARQIGERDFVQSVKDVIDATGLDPSCLELEVTESMVMHNVEEVVVILNSLNEMGIQISLDDFGTGFSSLAYLKRFPIDRLKIDQSFIFNCDSDAGDAIIAQTIIALAHGLKIKVIAEGIEKPEHFAFLKENGCDEGQGYFISRPLAFKDLRELLIARQKPH
ncbi:MAG: EAL domain-containing protein [Herminiimonas sp.]|uniref:EAL domain-containing protein n=1 Tax=Herminiimonas sp. TaxID=1926289 RepID=UPI0027184BD7|nr:EAL domain-containing protein [Herminiimonas sp.]MDO9422499.1 EAL domain-containing protein [Herminiimonas sp.]